MIGNVDVVDVDRNIGWEINGYWGDFGFLCAGNYSTGFFKVCLNFDGSFDKMNVASGSLVRMGNNLVIVIAVPAAVTKGV